MLLPKRLLGGIQMLDKTELINWMKLYQQEILTTRQELNDLDAAIGDGDHGSNMERGMTAVVADLEAKEPAELSEIFKIIAMSLLAKVGGASGPLYGTAFLEMSKKARESADVAELISAGAAGIAKRGGAVAGDKTMLDVWLPVADSLQAQTLTPAKIQEFVQTTKSMQAKKGRASYLGERSIGHLDPGAVSSALLFETLLTTMQK